MIKKILMTIIILLFLGNVLLISRLVHFYKKSQIARLYIVREFPHVPTDEPVVLMLGDSRISCWDPLPKINGLLLKNCGQGGMTSSELLMQIIHTDFPETSTLAIIQIGINDLKMIGFSHENEKQIVRCYKQNIAQIITLFEESGINVILLPIFPPSEPTLLRRPFWTDNIYSTVMEVNNHLHSLNNAGVIVPDCSGLAASNNKLKKEYVLDTLHLNKNAYQYLNEIILPEIRRFTKEEGAGVEP